MDLMEKILTVFFSGTGGVKRAADNFEKELTARGCRIFTYNLDDLAAGKDMGEMTTFLETADRLLLVYAVHALDAPDPVYDWMEKIKGRNIPAAVLSVSGGGETWPNTTCRQSCIATLEKKGFNVNYEEMLIMPCNWVFSLSDTLSMHLLAILPVKVKRIAGSILAGEVRRIPRRKPDLLQKHLPAMEKRGTRNFPRSIKISRDCNGCGWCSRNCPTGNISLRQDHPVFTDKCIACFRCVYGCPAKAMRSNNFMVLKKGFSLAELEKRNTGKPLGPWQPEIKGKAFAALGEYLSEGES
jgi:ferredoxin/flavodoxin